MNWCAILVKTILFAFFLTHDAHAKTVRVAIIGGGPTGTKVASELEGLGLEIDLYESNSSIGGRTKSRRVTLKNGKAITINTGTQMNFEQFLEEQSDLAQIPDMFYIPTQTVLSLSTSLNSGRLELFNLERAYDPGDPERSRKIGEKMIELGFLRDVDMALSGLAAYTVDKEWLEDLPFDDLLPYFQKNKDWDAVDAETLLKKLSIELQPHTAWGDWFGASKLWLEYNSLSKGAKKAEVAAKILENSLYYGILPKIGRKYRAYFTPDYVKKVVQSLEGLVEFTDLKSMSAINFLWQLKWVVHGGRILVAKKGWDKIPEHYLAKAKGTHVHLGAKVNKIKRSTTGFELEVQRGDRVYNENYDLVVNTADTDVALDMIEFQDEFLDQFLRSNTYTSTIALHVEINQPMSRLFSGKKAPALVFEPGHLKNLGGVTFHSQLMGEDLGERDVVGLFLESHKAQELIQMSRKENWSEEELGLKAKSILMEELKQLSQRSSPRDFKAFVEALDEGAVISTQAWEKALPHFSKGHMKAVSDYRGTLGQNGHFYLGQALFGRSIAMVLPGVDKIKAQILEKIEKIKESKSTILTCSSLLK